MKPFTLKRIANILAGKCPHCEAAKVFDTEKNYFFHIAKIKDNCSNCGYRFDREHGYFIGAMYLSYAFAVFEGIATFLLAKFLFNVQSELILIAAIVIVLLLFAMRNFRLSRVLWMYIFPN